MVNKYRQSDNQRSDCGQARGMGKSNQGLCFGHYIQCSKLCNDLLDTVWRELLRDRSYDIPDTYIINLAETPPECGLQRLILSLLVWEEDKRAWDNIIDRKDWLKCLPIDFCHDLLIHANRQLSTYGSGSPFNRARPDINLFRHGDEGK